MQTSYQRLSVTLGFSLLLILLIVNGVITRRQLGVQVGDQVWVTHTQQVLFEVSQTESLLKDAETGQRGFLYTGDSKYLAPYDLAVDQVAGHIDRLAELTADNPREQARISELRGLVAAKLSELGQTISYYRAGQPEEAKALVVSDHGRVLMDRIRTLTDEMVQEEDSLWAARSATYEKSVRVTIACIYLASGLAAVGLGFLAYFILHAINLRERHARQLAEREEWFRVTLTSLGDAVIATDEQGQVTFLNTVAEELMGVKVEQAKGRAITEVFRIFNESTLLPVENPVKIVMELGRIVGLANHTVLERSDGVMIPIEDSAAPIRDDRERLVGVVLVFRDATFERKSQELLRKSEKLAAAARLSATVAHEINNPLEAVGNLLYLAKGSAGVPAGAAEYLGLAEQELERISHITRQTLGFYRESKVPDEIDVAALVESVLKIYSNKLSTKNIRLERHFSTCPMILGLAGELKQVIANLVSNAADAAPENGTIRVGLSCVETSEGKMVEVSVQDDGPGIKPEHHEMIFEPFFTTKKDVGTGLGLWVSKEIVDRHGGRIQALSLNDNGSSGTLFNVHLPLGGGGGSAAQES
jgi:PAS domain S-box-containing protein